jgi:nucleoside phosphorylase
VARTLEQGAAAAQSLASDMIEDLSPGMLFLVGIAGGVPVREYSLGDVILVSRLYDFCVSAANSEHEREWDVRGGPMHFQVRRILEAIPAWEEKELLGWNECGSIAFPRPLVGSLSLSDSRLYGSDEWRQNTLESLKANIEGRQTPRFRVGPIASGNTLVKDPQLVGEWQKSGGRIIHGVEMELSGVFEACLRHDGVYPVLAIRGLSDIIGFRRSQEWTEYACHSAASIAIKLLSTGRIRKLGSCDL